MSRIGVFFKLIIGIFCFQHAFAGENSIVGTYLGSREGDPLSLVENVSAIHGDYTEIEVDLTVSAPDSLILSRFYSSRDDRKTAAFGGWRFYPQCFLSTQTHPEKNDAVYVYVGTSEGSILSYVSCRHPMNAKKSLFKIDADAEIRGLANSARGTVNAWTNLKNNELYFDPQNNSFELVLSSGGKRFYLRHPTRDIYLLSYEILPSGNKIFYEFDEQCRLFLVKETNASEKKLLAWIKLHYANGIHVEASDGQTVDYHFEKGADDCHLLREVIRSDKPDLHYQYQVVDGRALLAKKELPQGRFVQIDYYAEGENKNKVRSLTTPENAHQMTTTFFSYVEDLDGTGLTEVLGPSNRKTSYRFDERRQLICIQQYLDGSLYRSNKRFWGEKSDAANLIATSIEDGSGSTYYYKVLTYDDRGNIVEEREYGNLSGAGLIPLVIDENRKCNQEAHVKTYSYFSGKNTYGVIQGDVKGTKIETHYKKGTRLLLKKLITYTDFDEEENEEDEFIKKRCFYEYNDDAALVRVIVDDGSSQKAHYTHNVNERRITSIFPKQEFPGIGMPEIIEEKYLDTKENKEVLLKRTINKFDPQGNIGSQAVYDGNGDLRYSLTKVYQNGLLARETDPLGNETLYTYDKNNNLACINHSNSDFSIEYGYDLKNRLICTTERDGIGNRFETRVIHDPDANRLSEIDRFGNETIYIKDDLGRPLHSIYPEVKESPDSSIQPKYTFSYDIFDHPLSITDPKGTVITTSYNVHGKETGIHFPDGTQELIKYDPEGSLHRYFGRDGLLQVFEYDEIGQLDHIEYYKRGSKGAEDGFKRKYYTSSAFHLNSEKDEEGWETTYTYDGAGRLSRIAKGNQKVGLIYDALGRAHGIKKWKSDDLFTLHVKEYDLLDRVVEERIESTKGHVLVKSRYVYNDAGQLAQVIGYPQNQESILAKYEYDGFGRLCKITSVFNHVTQIIHDTYIDERGQRARKQILIDPLDNQTEKLFDPADNLIKVIKRDKAGKLLAETDFFHDRFGNKTIEKAFVICRGELLRIYETQWIFDRGNQLRSMVLGKGTKDKQIFGLDYNAYGDVISKSSPDSKDLITYTYGTYGNLRKVSCQEGDCKSIHQLSYDLKGNIKEVMLPSSQIIQYSYDANNLLLSETVHENYDYFYQVKRTYDGEGRIKTLTLPDESSIVYSYVGPFVKSVKRFVSNQEKYQYQVSSRDQMGNLLEEVLPEQAGIRKQFWDKAGRRIEITCDLFQDKVLEYDPLDRILKRETTLNNEKYNTEYEYNGLGQLVAEKGEAWHAYIFDSLGNRLQQDGVLWKLNDANQLLETENASYTFDKNGNLATKTVHGKTWTYKHNPLNQLVSIEDPGKNISTFTYDLKGRRLTKCLKSKGKEPTTFSYFYLGDTELGCINENGTIIELKVPGDPNKPESSPCIAIELKKKAFVPLYDLQGNIACLIDLQQPKVVESYCYSVFGQEKIIDESGMVIPHSMVGNPWRYRAKSTDSKNGLIYFGQRYYDPETGRWISPDPAGDIDGPNLYVFARNNPLTYVDHFGLATQMSENQSKEFFDYFYGDVEPHCYCEAHRTCKRGGDIASSVGGISHGAVDFIIDSLHGLQTEAAYIGSAEMELALQERTQIIEAVERSQAKRMSAVEGWMLDALSIDRSDAVYQSFRSKTTLGLEICSWVTGGFGIVKGAIGFSKLAKMPMQMASLNVKGTYAVEGVLKVGKFTYSNTAAHHIKDIVKRGSNAGRLSRPYMKSPLTINEIMSARKPISDPGGIPGGLRWDVPGTFRGSEGTWELILHPESEIIYHFNFK